MQEKKKIIIGITKSNWGGAQKYVFDIATNLPKDKFEINVILGGNGILAKKLKDAGMVVFTIEELDRDIGFTKDYKAFRKILALLKVEKPDILHLNSTKMGFIGALAGKLARIRKIILTGHGWAFNETRPLYQRYLIKIIYCLNFLLIDRVIAVSQKTLTDVSSLINSKKTVVIHNGLAKINFLTKESAREKLIYLFPNLANQKNKIWLGTIAELHKSKGLNFAVDAIKKIDNVQSDKNTLSYLIIGNGEEKELLQKQIVKNNLVNQITLLGFLDEASSYLKAFDIFILPSITEALPYIILEAGLAKLPIIASKVGGIPEIINNDKDGLLVNPRDINGICEAVNKIIKNPEQADEMSDKISIKIRKDFSLSKMVQETISIYNETL